MKSYSVFCKDGYCPIFVRNGFSFFCFFFTFFCLLFNKMWDRSIIVLSAYVIIYCFLKADFVNPRGAISLLLLLMFLCGINFSYWRGEHLVSKMGLKEYLVYSGCLLGAKLKFYELYGDELRVV